MSRFWLVKGNPRRNDLHAMLAPGRDERWVTRKPPRGWAAGDHVLMWKSSPDLCLVGLAEITRVRPPDRAGAAFFDLRYRTAPFEHTLGIQMLRDDAVVGGASFLKAGAAGTVFPLEEAQARRLMKLAVRRNEGLRAIEAEWFGPRSRAQPVARSSVVEGAGPLRALSIRQPWAELILRGEKDVENRSRPTKHRGPLVVHASGTPNKEAMAEYGFDALPMGCLVGIVDVVDCSEEVASPWHEEGYQGWYLANPRRFARPVPWKGSLGFFNVPRRVVREALGAG